jgi:hypothetical protein
VNRVKKSTGNTERTDREKLELFLRKVEELVAIALELSEIEMDILEAKSLGRLLSRMFAPEQQTREDIYNIAAVRGK